MKKYLPWIIGLLVLVVLAGLAYFALSLPTAHETIGSFTKQPGTATGADPAAPSAGGSQIAYQQNLPASGNNGAASIPVVPFVTKADSTDCNILMANQNIVANQGTVITWGSANAASYDLSGEQLALTGAAAAGSKNIRIATPGKYTYKATAHLKDGKTANCTLDISVAPSSQASPTQVLDYTVPEGGSKLDISPGQAIEFTSGSSASVFQVFVVSSDGKVADIRVRKTTGAKVEARELRLQKGEHGLFMNFTQTGLYVTVNDFGGNSVNVTVVPQKTGP